jgi:hypothetical protein
VPVSAASAASAARAAVLPVTLILAGAVAGSSTGARAAAGEAFTVGRVTFWSAEGRWTPAERRAIEDALARLPRPLTAQRPLTIVRDPRLPCEADGLPPDAAAFDEAAARGHLCVAATTTGARAPGEAPGLAMQAATMVLFATDVAQRWSDREEWRRLNGWRPALSHLLFARPANQAREGFAHGGGRRSPRWDLATFAAAYLLDTAAGDAHIGCRLMSQAAFLRARLAEIAPPGDDDRARAAFTGDARGTAPVCAGFAAWADLDRLAGVELVLAAPSTVMVGSLFGHVFLRLVYGDGARETPPHLARTIAFLADNDAPLTDDPYYALKGILGYYSASLYERSFLDTYREYVVVEGRDLRRWRLNLTADERQVLMERIWTVRQSARLDYYFFRRNCATLMVDLLGDVLPAARAMSTPGLLAAPPASALERFAEAQGRDGRPLIAFVPEPILSLEHEARLASRRRREREGIILRTLGDAEAAANGAFADARDADPARRAAAYERLGALLGGAGAGAAADVRDYVHDSAAIETYLSTVANLDLEGRAHRAKQQALRAEVDALAAELHAAGADPVLQPAIDLAVERIRDSSGDARLDGYRRLRDVIAPPGPAASLPDRVVARLRLFALLQSELRYDVGRMTGVAGLRDALLFERPDEPIDRQPYLRGREEMIRIPSVTRVSPALRSLQRAKEVVFRRRGDELARAEIDGEGDGAQTAAARDPAAVAVAVAVAREYEGSLPRSGIDQLAVLSTVTVGVEPRGSTTPGLALDGALYDERLGDHRRFGFPSHTALVVGRSRLLLSLLGGRPALGGYEARALGYRSLRPVLAESAAAHPLLSALGWEAYLDGLGSRSRSIATALQAGGGLLLPLWERGELAEHLLLALGLAYDLYLPTAGAHRFGGTPQGIAAPISLEYRRDAAFGPWSGHRSWLAARAWGRPIWLPTAAADFATFEVGLSAEAHLALRRIATAASHDPALILRAEAARRTIDLGGATPATQVIVSAGLELR